MDRHNWAALSALDTDAQKLVWLGSLASGPVEIPDPYTLDDAATERVVARMHELSRRLAQAIRMR